ncbi:MAG: DUF4870 domain-containing protein [Mycobacteriales bacterium]
MSDQTSSPDPWATSQPPYPPPSGTPAAYPPGEYPPGAYQQPGYQQLGYQQQGYQQQGAMPQGYVPPTQSPVRPGPYSPLVGRPLVSAETTWATLVHLSVFALSLIGPIIVMLTEGKKSAFTRHHAVEALNMHLTLLIVELVCFATFFLIVPLLFLFVAAIAAMVYAVIGAMAANRGEDFRYPLIWRMVK